MRNQHTNENLKHVEAKQIAVAQLEMVGLPLRIINLLENELGVIWLEDLLSYTPSQLKESVPNLGDKSVTSIVESVNQFLGRQVASTQRMIHLDNSLPASAP